MTIADANIVSIAPFNFPAMIPLWTIPLATATGNTLILKPSERDPGAAMMIAELCARAGVYHCTDTSKRHTDRLG